MNIELASGVTAFNFVVDHSASRNKLESLPIVQEMIDAGADVNAQDSSGNAAIDIVLDHYACPLQIFLRAGADISHVPDARHRAVLRAVLWDMTTKHILEAMGDPGSTVYAVTEGNDYWDLFNQQSPSLQIKTN